MLRINRNYKIVLKKERGDYFVIGGEICSLCEAVVVLPVPLTTGGIVIGIPHVLVAF